jgi:hypothetical protein
MAIRFLLSSNLPVAVIVPKSLKSVGSTRRGSRRKEMPMFPDIDEIRKTRKKYNWKMYQSGIELFREMGELERKAMQDGALPQRQKELIALGISISKSCYG